MDIIGTPWGRPDDNIGIGYAFLDGGNGDLSAAHVAEVYYRFAVTEHLGLTADAQYLNDNIKADTGPSGFILGLRATATF
ncbi:MAG: carbohydrate porin [Rhodospirillales bacterium]|nr:carbohydrate porin [Rhodospirillales bacterium]